MTQDMMAKPATKYFDGGFIRFKTRQGQLSFRVVFVSKQMMFTFADWQKVKDESQLKELLSVKTREYFTNVTRGSLD